jgi:hypothetical protein
VSGVYAPSSGGRLIGVRPLACGARFPVARPSATLCPRPSTTFSALGLVVPVSPYFGADIWQGMGLDGLWVNTRRLIYLLRVIIAILEETRR